MSTTGTNTVQRAWYALAPKLVAFLAAGGGATLIVLVFEITGYQVPPEAATILVGGAATVASYIQRDRLLEVGPRQFSAKVIAFMLTSASSAAVVALLAAFGLDLSGYATVIAAGLVVASTIVGYLVGDRQEDLALAA